VSGHTAQVRELRDQGLTAYAISCVTGLSLSEVRRAEDPRAQQAHERWFAAREAADEAERVFGVRGE
jgi:hypothetical protein